MRKAAVVVGIVASLVSPAEARKARKSKKGPSHASAQASKAIEELAGEFKWGLSKDAVQDLILRRLRTEYEERIQKAPDQMEQQRVRDDLARKEKDLRDSYIRFEGQKTGWDVSFLDKEFAHRNSESMLYRWEQDQRRFFFFYDGRLYKMAISLSQKLFKDKSFNDFAELMQQRYGKAEPMFGAPDATGQQFAEGLEWPPAGPTVLRAVNHTGFYGTYILVLYDLPQASRVAEGRQVNSPRAQTQSDLVEEALSGEARGGSMIDDDVVDRVTGRAAEGAEAASSEEGLAPDPGSSKQKPKKESPVKKKPVRASDKPLDGVE